jgi:hypothetical protein
MIVFEKSCAENHGCDQDAVYMANDISASGFALPDDGQENLVVKGGNNLDWAGAGMDQQASEIISFVAVQKAMTNGFTEAAEVMEENLGGCTELILSRHAQVAVKQRREIGVRLKDCDHSPSIRMQDTECLSEAAKRRGGKRKREMA